VKRVLLMVFLVGVSIACLWLAFADIFAPTPAPHKGSAANSANAGANIAGVGSGSEAGAATNASSAVGAGGSSGPAGVTNSSKTNSSTSFLPCQSTCQTSSSTCQSDCYQHYNVTNQTQYWNQCMQSCSTKLSVCSNNCISGLSLPPISTVLPPAPAAESSQPSARTRPTPSVGQQDDSSSSSSSSSGH